MTLLNFTQSTRTTLKKGEHKRELQNFIISEKNHSFRIYDDFGTTLDDFEKGTPEKMTTQYDPENKTLILTKGEKGNTIKNTRFKNGTRTKGNTYYQTPTGFYRYLIEHINDFEEPLKLKITPNKTKTTFKIDLTPIIK